MMDKIYWTKGTVDASGFIFPYFVIFKDKKKLYLTIYDSPGKKRKIPIYSMKNGKDMAAKYLKGKVFEEFGN